MVQDTRVKGSELVLILKERRNIVTGVTVVWRIKFDRSSTTIECTFREALIVHYGRHNHFKVH